MEKYLLLVNGVLFAIMLQRLQLLHALCNAANTYMVKFLYAVRNMQLLQLLYAVCSAAISVCVAAVLEAGQGGLHQDHAEPRPGCQTPAEGH